LPQKRIIENLHENDIFEKYLYRCSLEVSTSLVLDKDSMREDMPAKIMDNELEMNQMITPTGK
jgi:hypothetical protein